MNERNGSARILWIALIGLSMLAVSLALGPSALVGSAPHQANPAADELYFQGHVYEGDPGDESRPISGVSVELYCSNSDQPGYQQGTLCGTATTNASGWYQLYVPATSYDYYNIIETDPSGYYSVEARCVEQFGVEIMSDNWIRYTGYIGKDLTGNKFWDKRLSTSTPTATATKTRTPTATRTGTPGPTSTSTKTPTRTGTKTATHTTTRTKTATPTATPTLWPVGEIIAVPWFPVATMVVVNILPPPDFQIKNIEITQGIQCLNRTGTPACADNSLPLVMERWAVARVYVTTPGLDVSKVPVRLHLYLDSTSGYYTYADGYTTAVLSPNRENKLHSANIYFKITGGSDTTLLYYAEVNPQHSISESNYNNNRFPSSGTKSVVFDEQSTLEIVPVLIDYTGDNSHKAPPSGFLSTFDEFMRIYPIADVNLNTSPQRYLAWTQELKTEAQWDALLTALGNLRNNDSVKDAHWYGLVDSDMPLASIGGMGWIGRYSAGSADWQAAGIMLNKGIATHEVGHNLARWHAPCGVSAGLDTNYPYSGGVIKEVGWDLSTSTVINASAPDLMSYCSNHWISDYNWKHMFTRRDLLAPAGGAAASAAQEIPHVSVGGYVEGSGDVSFYPFQKVMLPAGTSDYPGEGPLRIEIQNEMGMPLFARWCDIMAGGGSVDEPGGSFRETMPLPEGARFIRLYAGDSVRAERRISDHDPVVHITQPSAAQAWLGSEWRTLAWDAWDEDGDRLTFAVQVSADGGQTWAAIGVWINKRTYDVNPAYLAGSENTLFRVIANDGFREGYDTTDVPIAIEPKRPEAIIIDPQPGTLLTPGIPVVLIGAGYDTEDGTLPENALEWHSDRDGFLGFGSTVIIPALSRGRHQIVLRVVDSDGMEGFAETWVFFGSRTFLPVVLKNRASPGATATPTRTPTRTSTTPAGTAIFSDNFNDGDLAGWTPNGGNWTNPSTYMRGQHTTNGYNVRNESGSDIIYEGTVNLLSGDAAGLIFRASADGSTNYCVVLDASVNALKLCRNFPGWVTTFYPMEVQRGHQYRIKVVANGTNLDVYLDDVKRIATWDSANTTGKFGVIVYHATAAFDNLEARRLP